MYTILSDASFRHSDGTGVLAYLILSSNQDLSQLEPVTGTIKLVAIREVNNIRCEMRSVLAALKNFRILHPDPFGQEIHLYTDCQAISGLGKRRERLEKNGFMSGKTGLLLHNADLYQEMFEAFDRNQPTIHWIKGHNHQPGNCPKARLFRQVDQAARHYLRQQPHAAPLPS